jgi:ATP/maltotriose-dependent transcriptional regulator MalT
VLWSCSSVDVSGLVAASAAARIRRGSGLPGRVWEAGEPLTVISLEEVSRGPREEAALLDGLRGAVALPALHSGEVLAVVELVSLERAELTDRLMRCLAAVGHQLGEFLSHRRGALQPALMTRRELQVLQLVAWGLSVRDIAEQLVVSTGTVRTHLDHIYAKLGIGDRAAAAAEAVRLGLIE